MAIEITPLSGDLKTVFEIEKGLTEYALTHPINLKNTLIKDHDISDTTLLKASFVNTHWEDVVYQDAIITNVTFKGGSLNDISFSDSILTNVVFEDMSIEQAEFTNARLINVLFKSCKLTNSNFENLQSSKVIFDNSDLNEISFFQSQLDITISNSKLFESGSFIGLKTGSKIAIMKSLIGPNSEFDKSNLISFTAIDSTFVDAKMNFATIDELVIKNSELDFPIASGDFNKVRLENIKDSILLGLSKINTLTIEDCQEDIDINLLESKFKNIAIRNCLVSELNISDAYGEKIHLSQIKASDVDLSSLIVKEMILTDFTITDSANFQGALAEESQVTNFKIKTGAKVIMDGTNIKFH